MRCLKCKAEALEESTTSYIAKQRKEGQCVTIEKIPCYKCNRCGEIYYKASVLEQIEDILK